MKKSIYVLIGILCVAPMISQAANLKNEIPTPKTKFEQFSAKTGVVLFVVLKKLVRSAVFTAHLSRCNQRSLST